MPTYDIKTKLAEYRNTMEKTYAEDNDGKLTKEHLETIDFNIKGMEKLLLSKNSKSGIGGIGA